MLLSTKAGETIRSHVLQHKFEQECLAGPAEQPDGGIMEKVSAVDDANGRAFQSDATQGRGIVNLDHHPVR